MAAGTRRVRRRAGLAVVGGLAALALVGGTVAAVQGGGEDRATDPVALPTGPTAPVTWAEGTVIHVGGQQIDVGVPVEAFVRTSAGFVVASRGEVYAVDGADVQKVGEIDTRRPHLVSDEDGSLAGWVQSGNGSAQYVVHDLAANVTSVHAQVPASGVEELDGESFYALDSGTAYWLDERGAVAVDLATGQATVIDAAPSAGFEILDAEDGTLAFQVPDSGDAGNDGTFVGRGPARRLRGLRCALPRRAVVQRRRRRARCLRHHLG